MAGDRRPSRRQRENRGPTRVGGPWPVPIGGAEPDRWQFEQSLRASATRYEAHLRSCERCHEFEEHPLRAVMRCEEGERLDAELDRLLCDRHYEVVHGIKGFYHGRDPFADVLRDLEREHSPY